MPVFMVLLLLIIISLWFALKKRKPIFLLIPFVSIFAYFLVQVALVPAPFVETLKFIFTLR